MSAKKRFGMSWQSYMSNEANDEERMPNERRSDDYSSFVHDRRDSSTAIARFN